MKKMLLLAAVVVLVMSAPSFAATENLSFGGSAQFEGIYLFKDNAPDIHFNQSEIYLWATADLADNVMAKINIKYRNNFGATPSGIADANTGGAGNLVLQEGYVKLGKIWESPVTVVIGRWVNEQANSSEIDINGNRSKLVPYYGEGFIIPNNNPVDGGKLTYDGGNWWVDGLWYKNTKSAILNSSDNTLYGAYGQYNGIENQKIDAYALYIQNAATAVEAETLIFGARATGKITPVDGLSYKAEGAYSHTHVTGPGDEPDGFGGLAGVNYVFSNVQYSPAAHLNFYWLDHNFTQPYGHVDQDDLGEIGYGRVVDNASNLNSLTNGSAGGRGVYFGNLGATIKPAEKWSVDGDYYHYNAAWGNSVIGHEVDLRLSYQYSENVAAELIGGYYISPGNKTGSTQSALLGLPGDAYLLKGGIKVNF